MLKKRVLIILSLFVISILALTGCTGEEANLSNSGADEETIAIEHPLGEAIVNKNPERVIVFDYATLDILDNMGIDIIGLPKQSTIPEYLDKYNDEKYEDVGSLKEPNFEKIYELNPDVIFISDRQAEIYEEFNEIAPTVYLEVDGAKYMDSVTKNATMLGQIFGKEDLIEEELGKINEAIEKINSEVKEKGIKALTVMANDGSTSAFGEGSRFGAIHNEFGFPPVDPEIEVSKHGQSITFEYILEKNPDYVFIIDRAATAGGNISAEQIFDNGLIEQTDAYKNGNIVYLSSQVWYVASGGLTGTIIMIEDIQSSL